LHYNEVSFFFDIVPHDVKQRSYNIIFYVAVISFLGIGPLSLSKGPFES